MSEKERHFIVKGVKKNLCGFGYFQYPERGDIEAPDWNNEKRCSGGIFGIDWESPFYEIRNEMYLIIEYNPDDGVVRLYDEKLKIRKGVVVYSSSDIKKIQEWLESHGDRYRGYGANLTVGDNETVECGDKCTVIAGNNCNIKVDYGSYVRSGNKCIIYSGACSSVEAGDNCKVLAGVWSTLSGGEGTSLSWEDGFGLDSHDMLITEKESGKKYLGAIVGSIWKITQIEE